MRSSVSSLRSLLYRSARVLGDAQAVPKGPTAVVKRIERRALGRLMSVVGREVMVAIEAYAIQLGCVVNGDEIVCTTGIQSELLTRKWNELTGVK